MAKAAGDFYGYDPSVVLSGIAIAVFTILTAFHIWRLFKTRTWFCIPFTIGGLFEIIGFAARAVGHTNRYYSHTNAGPLVAFIIQACLILLAPLFYTASVYMFLGRIIRATGHPSYSPVPTKWLTKIFVAGDLMCLNIQSTGASILSNAKGDARKANIATNIVMGGLVLQILIFGFFVATAWVFQNRMRKGPLSAGTQIASGWNWLGYLYMLYVVSGIITFRNIYRVVEYAMGDEGYLMTKEWSVYVLDALPMAVVLVICAKWYVGDLEELLKADGGNVELTANSQSASDTSPRV